MPAPTLSIVYGPFTRDVADDDYDDDDDIQYSDEEDDDDDGKSEDDIDVPYDTSDETDSDRLFTSNSVDDVSKMSIDKTDALVSTGHAQSGRVIGFAGTIALAYNAVGVIYGDIGTSPLYAFTAVFQTPPSADDVVGMTSLIIWSLTMCVTFKYILCVLNADNQGEGGIFALLALCRNALQKTRQKASTANSPFIPDNRFIRAVTIIAFFGCSLLIGDGIITPAISILSSVEGIAVAFPSFTPFNVPLTILLLIGLFSFQQYGTSKVAKYFAPIMIVWFLSIGMIGFINIINADISVVYQTFSAISPWQWINYMIRNGSRGYHELAGVILCITGVEALYTDLGHFNLLSIRISWLFLVYPTLILNYLGQGILLLINPNYVDNPFYHSVPSLLYWPMVLLSTFATIIASQAMISGAFSLIKSANQLNFLPFLFIKYTNENMNGQIYIPFVNWSICIGSCMIVIIFQSSAALTGAYGMAVCLDMLITSILFICVMIIVWKCSIYYIVIYIIIFIPIDISFVGANLIKFMSGGYLPVTFALILATSMYIWDWGYNQLNAQSHGKRTLDGVVVTHNTTEKDDEQVQEGTQENEQDDDDTNIYCHNADDFDINDFIKIIEQSLIPINQTQSTGIFFYNNNKVKEKIPVTVYYLMNYIHVFPQRSLFLDITYIDQPYILAENRLNINIHSFIANKQEYKIYNCTAKYGFMEQNHINIPILIESIFNQITLIKDENINIETQSKTNNNHLWSVTGSEDSEAKSVIAMNEESDDRHHLMEDISTNNSDNRGLHTCVTYYLGKETLITERSSIMSYGSVIIVDSSLSCLTIIRHKLRIFVSWIRILISKFFMMIFNTMSQLSGGDSYNGLPSAEVVQLGIRIPINIR